MPCSHCRKPGHTYITCPTISPEEKQRIIDRNTLKRKKQKNKNVNKNEKKSSSNEDFIKVRQEQRERQRQLQLKKLEEMHKAQELQQQWILGCQAIKKSWEQKNKETSKMILSQNSEYEKALKIDLARQKKEEEDSKLAEPTKEFLRELRLARFEKT